MTKPDRLELWQVLAPILDESVLQSLRDMDDPDAERDHHDAERIADYKDTVMDLANWLVPEEEAYKPVFPSLSDNPLDLIMASQLGQRRQLRSILTKEAERAERGE